MFQYYIYTIGQNVHNIACGFSIALGFCLFGSIFFVVISFVEKLQTRKLSIITFIVAMIMFIASLSLYIVVPDLQDIYDTKEILNKIKGGRDEAKN